MLITFHLVLFGWIFFRVASLADALMAIRKMAGALVSGQFTAPPLWVAGWIAVLLAVDWVGRRNLGPLMGLSSLPRPIRWLAYYAVATGTLLFADLHYSPFIYFQF
jgi:alginate O-acetyltransferase complex protein AlgI